MNSKILIVGHNGGLTSRDGIGALMKAPGLSEDLVQRKKDILFEMPPKIDIPYFEPMGRNLDSQTWKRRNKKQ